MDNHPFKELIAPIIDSIDENELTNFQPVHKRYYEEKTIPYSSNNKKCDIMHRIHTNKIVLVYISSDNDLITHNKTVKRLQFQVGDKDRSKVKVHGKHKKGAQKLTPSSVICFVETEDGEKYPVHAGARGKLIEINQLVVDNPNLIVEDRAKGYIAIILPDLPKE